MHLPSCLLTCSSFLKLQIDRHSSLTDFHPATSNAIPAYGELAKFELCTTIIFTDTYTHIATGIWEVVRWYVHAFCMVGSLCTHRYLIMSLRSDAKLRLSTPPCRHTNYLNLQSQPRKQPTIGHCNRVTNTCTKLSQPSDWCSDHDL
jgi:hypothetical protein